MACPNCGASVRVDITSICSYCDTALISGKFGWLLTGITGFSPKKRKTDHRSVVGFPAP
jgi:hypothetical protein